MKAHIKLTNKQYSILLAVANGCRNTRQVAKRLLLPLGAVNNYFYPSYNWRGPIFKNGDVLQWEPKKGNTLRIGPKAAVVRHRGLVVAVMRAEKVAGIDK
jgi:hypothetical protein